MKDKETKENKGFAFVTFTAKDVAQRAIEELHDKDHKVVYVCVIFAGYCG